ncbi:MAG TPA: enoyl-CoA hydratase/isomerase family protein [Candidatus Sulfotelmatobacter sp.]
MLRIRSDDEINCLDRGLVELLTARVADLAAGANCAALVIAGSSRFFSSGANLNELVRLNGPTALEFSRMGQAMMSAIEQFPAPTYAAISGYCMGGGLDLALACRYRIASPEAVFGHRGAALGLLTGWGGTQRLPRLIGKGRALHMLVAAEKIDTAEALRIGLIDAIEKDPVAVCIKRASQ